MAMWWITVALHLGISYAQLTSPDEPVCVGKQAVFSCQQAGFSRWTVNLPSREEQLSSPLLPSTLSETELMLDNDPGYGFTVHLLSTSQGIHSELHVTAVSELNGAIVSCLGGIQTLPSTIQISLEDPPSAPSGVQTTVDESQFTPSTASITLTWSASSGADNYTIVVTPPLPSGEFLLSTATTSQHLTVLYNMLYSINITTHNCGGSNSTIVNPSPVVGCIIPSSFGNGIINKHHSGGVGAMLTFRCDPGYMPQVRTSVCMPNTSWVPPPECNVLSCGDPNFVDGIVVKTFNDTKLDAVISVHCDESDILMMVVCDSNGEWFPHPASFRCKNGTLVSQCGPPTAPVNGHINNNFSSTVEGSQITFHCGGSPVMTSTCSNGSWIPNPAKLDCGGGASIDGRGASDPGRYIAISAALVLLVFVLITISIIVIVFVKKMRGMRPKLLSFELDSYQKFNQNSEYAQTRHPGPRIINQAVEEYSVFCHSAPSENSKTHPVTDQIDTLVYADIGPSSTKRSTHCPATSNVQDDHRVVYSSVNLELHQPVKKSTHNKSGPCPADKSLNLDSLLIQLKPQAMDKWEQFAEAVGLSNIIPQLSSYSPDECIVEVFDQWLKSHPTKPTWRNVADVLNDIGLHQLAEDILKVYETGKLPIIVDMDAVPENLTSDNGTPPPLPPKLVDGDLDCKVESVQHGERSAAVPPRPPKPPTRPPKPVF